MNARAARTACVLVFCQSVAAFAADIEFTGILERLRSQSITLRIADGRQIDALLPDSSSLSARALAAKYKLADQVRISYREILRQYDSAAALHLHLELKSIKLLREPTADELAETIDLVSSRPGENLLARPDSPASPANPSELERVRTVNLANAGKLPNFIADETARRYSALYESPGWRFQDTIESEVAFDGQRAIRRHIRLDGQPWTQPFEELPGYLWAVWFGLELNPLFKPDCNTSIASDGRRQSGDRPVLAFHFSSPRNGCFAPYVFKNHPGEVIPARNGRFLAEDPQGHVIWFEAVSSGFPEDFPLDRSTATEQWSYVKIGGDTFLLPVGAEIITLSAEGFWTRVAIEYANHRHFDASTTIIYH